MLFLVFLTLIQFCSAAFMPEVHSTIHDHVSDTILYFDDSAVLLNLNHGLLYRSENDGRDWVLQNIGKVHSIYIDPLKKERAIAFSAEKTHHVTSDRGQTWNSFSLDMHSNMNYEVNVNSRNPDKVLLAFLECYDGACRNNVFYTTDGFKTNPQRLAPNLKLTYCSFANSNGIFDTEYEDAMFCINNAVDSHGYITTSELLRTEDFFKSSTVVDDPTGSLSKSYIYELRVIQDFIVALVMDDRYEGTGSAMSLYVSKDSVNFGKAIFDSDIITDGFVFLPSTKSSLYLSVFGQTANNKAISDVLASDSEGLHFRKLLDGVAQSYFAGFVNLEKLETLEGVWMANVLEGIDPETYTPMSRTKISFDDGRTWQLLKTDDCPGDDSCSLNLLSSEERRGDGQSSTGATPGILLGVGSTGKTLETDVLKMHTYLSRDGGLHWTRVLDDPTVYNFGDLGNVIVAVPYTSQQGKQDNLLTDKIYYTLNQGKTWETFNIDHMIFPYLITTTIDDTTTKFVIGGIFKNGDKTSQVLYSLDFSKAFDRTCGDDDFEEWHARATDSQEFECVFGHKDLYKRRKQDADCFVNKPFQDLAAEEVACQCTDVDYECAFGWNKNQGGQCVPDYRVIMRACHEQENSTEIELPKRRKIPGNKCTGDLEVYVAKIDCEEAKSRSDNIRVFDTNFNGKVAKYTFLDAPDKGTDETLILKSSLNDVHMSFSGGKDFIKYSTTDEIYDYYLNPYFKDDIYLVTTTGKVHISQDRGRSFHIVTLPSNINVFGIPSFTFNKKSRDTFIFYGDENCQSRFSENCRSLSFITYDGGVHWKTMRGSIRICDFVGAKYEALSVNENTIYCQSLEKDGRYALVSSTDGFETEKVLFDSIVGFATTTRFTVVAAVDNDSLKAHVTLDGSTFAEALFPSNFKVGKQQAYTILGSETGAIFLHVTTNDRAGSEFGSILKSNSNGTSYVLSESQVNRNSYGYVDYERIEGLEGISIINTVTNADEARRGSRKQLQSKITFNDGADWSLITPPTSDSSGNKYPCVGKPLSECSLHLHGYTERKDFRDTFSSGSAIGLLLGVGNVGDKLLPFNEGSTFITADGGSTWKEAKKGVFQWEFGDRGSIIVLVDDQATTNVLHYSLDEGNTWTEYKFTEDNVNVDDIVTVPTDTSKRFLIIARSHSNRGDESRAFAIDFQDMFSRQCILDLEHPENDDYEYWSPKHPFSSSNCLFGHESKYLRKLSGRIDCFVGAAPLDDAFKVVRNCSCTRHDYECDFNYVKSSDGTCKLIDGLSPPDHSAICRADKNAFEYFKPTGYRKVPLSTCQDGQEFDKWNPIPCPGKEDKFKEAHGGKIRGSSLAIIIVVPIAIFFFALWFLYDKGIRRNGGFARFGEIRLGEDDDLIENNFTDVVVNSIIRGGVTVIAATIATFKMLKIFDNFLINKIKGVFRRDRRFTRGGAGYSTVNQGDFVDETEDILDDVLSEGEYDIDDDDDDVLGSSDRGTPHAEPDNNFELDNDAIGNEYTDDRNLES